MKTAPGDVSGGRFRWSALRTALCSPGPNTDALGAELLDHVARTLHARCRSAKALLGDMLIPRGSRRPSRVANLVNNSEVKVDSVTVGIVGRIDEELARQLSVERKDDIGLPADTTAKLAQKSLVDSEYV